MELTYKFTNKEVTSWGGMVFLRQFLNNIGFSEQVKHCDLLPQPGSNRGYELSVLLESFLCSIWCGATRFLHTEITRSDRALSKIFGWGTVPVIAFVNDVRLIANFWLRSGDSGASNNFLSFLENTFEKLENKSVSLIRLDSGFCSDNILSYLENGEKNYIVAAKFYHPIQHLIAGSENWILLDDGIEICEQMYQGKKWENARRIVIVRQKTSIRPQATGKTLSLFPEEEIHRNYRYSAYFTNFGLAPAEIWRIYCGRGDAENRIKEIKYDFGANSFNLKGFYATEAALMLAMMAYNLMSIFRMFVLQEKTQKRLATLRYRTFAIGAYFQKMNGNLVLTIALTKKRRR